MDGSGGLATPAFLVGDRDYAAADAADNNILNSLPHFDLSRSFSK